MLDLSINYNREISYFHPKNMIKTIAHFFKLNKEINKIQPDLIISVSTSPDEPSLNVDIGPLFARRNRIFDRIFDERLKQQ